MEGLHALEEALRTLGDVLGERGHTCRAVVVGGASLLLLGYVERPTADVDLIATVEDTGYARLDELPPFLVEAVRDVGRALGLGERWVNAGPAGLVDLGLPPGFERNVEIRHFGALELHVPSRVDLVCFKLYAATDLGERSKHFQDLLQLEATADELLRAARWARTHDSSLGFRVELVRVLALLGVEDADV